MKKALVWFGWFVVSVLSVLATLYLVKVNDVSVNLWILGGLLVMIEALPVLWVTGFIRHTVMVTVDFVGGLWSMFQLSLFLFNSYLAIEYIGETGWKYARALVLLPHLAMILFIHIILVVKMMSDSGKEEL